MHCNIGEFVFEYQNYLDLADFEAAPEIKWLPFLSALLEPMIGVEKLHGKKVVSIAFVTCGSRMSKPI